MIAALLQKLSLPADVSAAERLHLARMHRLALLCFFGHLPLLALLMWASGTSGPAAPSATLIVLAAPTLAWRYLSSPRVVSRVFAAAAVGLGGILVNLGQAPGPFAIGMHFHFFVVIALLAAFADPVAVIVAAAAVALAHVGSFVATPSGAYESSLGSLVGHLFFVVLEAVAVSLAARTWFDVIASADQVRAERTAVLATASLQLETVLDSVAAGVVIVGMDGAMSGDRSRAIERWLGPAVPGEKIWSYVGRSDASASAWIEMACSTLPGDRALATLALEQIPGRIRAGGRTLALSAKLAGGGERKVAFVLTDVTAEVERERQDADQRELLALCEHAVKDRRGLEEFLQETGRLVSKVVAGAEGSELRRALHTIKGNAAVFGASSVAGVSHELESELEVEGTLAQTGRRRLEACWNHVTSRLAELRGGERNTLDVDPDEHAELVRRLREGGSTKELAEHVDAWRFEGSTKRLRRIADQARNMAKELGRAPLEIIVDDNIDHLPEGDLSDFWASFLHLVRNAVDHGIEPAEERLAKGKPAQGRLVLRTLREEESVTVEIEDDGRGIDWENIALRARARDLPDTTEVDLMNALFTDGLSTRDEATQMSGRGIGMSAVRAECERLGASLSISRPSGGGTKFTVTFPVPATPAP